VLRIGSDKISCRDGKGSSLAEIVEQRTFNARALTSLFGTRDGGIKIGENPSFLGKLGKPTY
jgi:hypothetical protein